MRFTPLPVAGAYVVDIEPAHDERGFFARIFDADAFAALGLAREFVQLSLSFSRLRGTVRGLHYQDEPAVETKLVRCIRGAMHDVIVDLRPESPTYLAHAAVELSAENRRALYIPPIVAHGFQTLADDTETLYHIDAPYTPGAARGVRHDDPVLGVRWPLPVSVINAKDRSWPLLEPR